MARQLEVVFYGLACFQSINRGTAYRVLFPDGRDPSPYRIPVHTAAMWVRQRTSTATARWPWTAERNDYAIGERGKLTISGVKKTRLEAKGLTDQLVNLRDSDPTFTIAANPEAIVEMIVDRGTLTAHRFPTGMIVVKWVVEAEENTPITFTLGDAFVEISEDTTQVVLANAGEPELNRLSGDDHFLLYRKLATSSTGYIGWVDPKVEAPLLGVTLIEPAHSYMRPRTPLKDCSPVYVG